MFIDPRRNRPSGPMSPVPGRGPEPMDLANNPMAAAAPPAGAGGMLDPRVNEAYNRYLEAGQNRIDILNSQEAEKPSIGRSILQALPAVAMGIATGGAAIPAALAYASASGMADYEGDKQARKEWEIKRADAIAAQRASEFDAAGEVFGLPGAPGQQLQAKQGEKTWQTFNPRTGEWQDSGVPIKANRDQLSAFGKFIQEYTGKDINDPSLSPEERERLFEEFKKSSATRTMLSGNEGNVLSGAANIEGAKESGEQAEAIRFENARWIDTAEDTMDDFSMALDHTKEILGMIEEGTIGENLPLIGMVTQMFDESSAFLASEAVAQALQNLQIVNLAPVTEKEFAEIKKMFADISMGRPANIGRLKSSLQRIERAMDVAQRKIDRRMKRYNIAELRGRSATPGAPSEPVQSPVPSPASVPSPDGGFDLTYNPETGKFE